MRTKIRILKSSVFENERGRTVGAENSETEFSGTEIASRFFGNRRMAPTKAFVKRNPSRGLRAGDLVPDFNEPC